MLPTSCRFFLDSGKLFLVSSFLRMFDKVSFAKPFSLRKSATMLFPDPRLPVRPIIVGFVDGVMVGVVVGVWVERVEGVWVRRAWAGGSWVVGVVSVGMVCVVGWEVVVELVIVSLFFLSFIRLILVS